MEDVARRLGFSVARTPVLPRGLRGTCIRGEPLIVVRDETYAPRVEFAIAHEIVEQLLPAPFRAELEHGLKERVCNRAAAALLLPRQQFLFTLHGTGWNLPELRRRFPWASWSAIAGRLADLVPGVVASQWVNYSRTWWRAEPGVASADLAEAEQDAVAETYRGAGAAVIRRRNVRARAWRLTASGKRVAVAVCETN